MSNSLERLYRYMPVFAQNLGISMYGVAWRRERLGGKFSEYVHQFRERDDWSVGRMEEYVEQRLRQILCRAFDHVGYYQRAWSQIGIRRGDLAKMTLQQFRKLPITPKQDLRAAPEAFVAWDVPSGETRRYFSSGSTGTPITAICTPDDHRRFIAAREVRSFGWAGTSVYAPRSMIGGRLVVPKGISSPPFHRYNFAERQVYFSAYHISPAHVPEYVRAFNRHRPQLLTGYAHSHYLLARMMCEQGITLNYTPDAIVLCSEKLTHEMKSVIQKAFRARAYEEYGAVENCALATECEHGNLHISPDFGLLEVVDEKNQPVPPGVEGKILCTSFSNETQLLVRYEIGDVAMLSPVTCSCGRNQFPVLQEIVGRLEDVVIGRDGRELVRFHGIFIDLENVLEGQVIQEAIEQFTVKIVVRESFGERDEQIIRRRFAERLGPVYVAIEKVPQIPRTERGKFRAVISKVRHQNCLPRACVS